MLHKFYATTESCSRINTERPFDLSEIIRFVSRIRLSASLRFTFVSERVLPCVFTPGISSIQPEYHFPDFLYTAVNIFGYCFIITKEYHTCKLKANWYSHYLFWQPSHNSRGLLG